MCVCFAEFTAPVRPATVMDSAAYVSDSEEEVVWQPPEGRHSIAEDHHRHVTMEPVVKRPRLELPPILAKPVAPPPLHRQNATEDFSDNESAKSATTLIWGAASQDDYQMVDSANVKERELPEESQAVEETQVVVEKALEKVAEQVVEEAAIKEMPESQVVEETQVAVKTVSEQVVEEAAIKEMPSEESQVVEETQVPQQVVVSGEAGNADDAASGSSGSTGKRIYLRDMTPNSKERELQRRKEVAKNNSFKWHSKYQSKGVLQPGVKDHYERAQMSEAKHPEWKPSEALQEKALSKDLRLVRPVFMREWMEFTGVTMEQAARDWLESELRAQIMAARLGQQY